MKRDLTDAEYIAALEAKISSISEELSAVCKERDNLQEVILKMSDELRNLRRMMFGRKAERFIAEAPSQLSLSFEGVETLDEEREAEAIKAKEKQSTSKIEKNDNNCNTGNNRERRIFAEHLERRDEIIEPDTIPDGSKRIGEAVTELLEYKLGELYVRHLIRPKYAP